MFTFVSDEIFFCDIKEFNMMINGALVLNSRPRVKELKKGDSRSYPHRKRLRCLPTAEPSGATWPM